MRRAAPNLGYSIILMGYHQFHGAAKYRLSATWPNTKIDIAGFDIYEKYGVKKSGSRPTEWKQFTEHYFIPIQRGRSPRASPGAWPRPATATRPPRRSQLAAGDLQRDGRPQGRRLLLLQHQPAQPGELEAEHGREEGRLQGAEPGRSQDAVGDTAVVVARDTIPGLLAAAVARDPAGTWLRTDEGTLTFGGAAAHVAALVERLAESGVRRGDLVVVTARTTPPYVLCWLALATLGAVSVPTDPDGTATSSPGCWRQVQPRAVITDAGLMPLVRAHRLRPGRDVLDIDDLLADWRVEHPPPTCPDVDARRRGGADPDVGDHRAIEAGDADPPRLRLGRRGVPVVDGAHRRRPDDDVAAAVPHQRAGVLGAWGRWPSAPGWCCCRGSPRSGFLDSARRHGATEFNAIGAMLEILMRQPPRPDDAETDLRLCYTGPSPPGSGRRRSRSGSGCASSAATRCRSRRTG